jgi:hypothetical protein
MMAVFRTFAQGICEVARANTRRFYFNFAVAFGRGRGGGAGGIAGNLSEFVGDFFHDLPCLLSTCESPGSPMILLTMAGPRCPYKQGDRWFVALRFYAEECTFSLSSQAYGHV